MTMQVAEAVPAQRIPPHDSGAEAGVIGSMIIDPDTVPSVRDFLTERAFFDSRNAVIFRVICNLADVGIGIDALIVHSTLKTRGWLEEAGGVEHLRNLANAVPTSAHAEYYAAIVKEKAMYREAITVCTRTIRSAYLQESNAAEVLADLQRDAARVAENGAIVVGKPAGECLDAVLNEIHGTVEQQAEQAGLPTGLPAVDAKIGGLKNKHLIALCGHGKHGKTALGLGIVATVGLVVGEPAAVISFEMSKEELTKRLLLWTCEKSEQELRHGVPTARMANDFNAAQKAIRECRIILDDECSPNLVAVRQRLRLYRRRYGIKLAMIDYYQLMEGLDTRQRRYDALVEISRGLKMMTVEFDMPILVLAQLNAEAEKEDRLPRINDIEECKRLGKDANTVMLLDREFMRKKNISGWLDQNPDKIKRATLDIAGLRAGAGGIVELEYDAPITRFRSLPQW